MKDADNVPSPSRFCRRFGRRSPSVNTSAYTVPPRKCDNTTNRTRPATRLARMPVATANAAQRVRGAAALNPSRRRAPASMRAGEVLGPVVPELGGVVEVVAHADHLEPGLHDVLAVAFGAVHPLLDDAFGRAQAGGDVLAPRLRSAEP